MHYKTSTVTVVKKHSENVMLLGTINAAKFYNLRNLK